MWAIFAFLATTYAASRDSSRTGATFSLEQIPIDSPDLSIPEIIRAPYLKFGVEVPNEVEDAIIRDVLPGQTSVPTKSVDYDQNYGQSSYSCFCSGKCKGTEVLLT